MASKEAPASPQQRELPTQTNDYAITTTDCNSITEAKITLRRVREALQRHNPTI